MSVMHERPKVTEATYQTLKRYILRQRQKEVETLALDATKRRMRAERLEARREIAQSLQRADQEVLRLEKKLEELKREKSELFQRFKMVSAKESRQRTLRGRRLQQQHQQQQQQQSQQPQHQQQEAQQLQQQQQRQQLQMQMAHRLPAPSALRPLWQHPRLPTPQFGFPPPPTPPPPPASLFAGQPPLLDAGFAVGHRHAASYQEAAAYAAAAAAAYGPGALSHFILPPHHFQHPIPFARHEPGARSQR